MFSEALEELIEMAISEGELSDKSRQILLKRADKEGLDADEFELILESRLAKRRKALGLTEAPQAAPIVPPTPPVAPAPQPTSQKMGTIDKCPACGAIVETGTLSCTECGYTFKNIKGNSSVQRFADILREIELRHQTAATENNKGMLNSLTRSFGASSRKDEICTAIDTFPIPNSKEDLLEFLCFLKPKSEKNKKSGVTKVVNGYMNVATLGIYGAVTKSNGDSITNAYKAKYEECLNKAMLYIKTDSDFEELLVQNGILQKKKKFFGK